MSGKPVELSKCYRLRYPDKNVVGAGSRYETRRIRVESIRDPEIHPISPLTIASAPGIRREGVLVTAWDLDRGGRRMFWSGRWRDLVEIEAPPMPIYGVAMVEATVEIQTIYQTADVQFAAKMAADMRAYCESMGVKTFVRVERVA